MLTWQKLATWVASGDKYVYFDLKAHNEDLFKGLGQESFHHFKTFDSRIHGEVSLHFTDCRLESNALYIYQYQLNLWELFMGRNIFVSAFYVELRSYISGLYVSAWCSSLGTTDCCPRRLGGEISNYPSFPLPTPSLFLSPSHSLSSCQSLLDAKFRH
jgi:hypothetical protein